MDKWLKYILADKDPYHNRGRDQMRKKGGSEFECLWVDIAGGKDDKQRGPIRHNEAKKKLQLKHKNSLFTLQTFHYNYY
jgi:hypothetical protein